jgi:hypothetical protein
MNLLDQRRSGVLLHPSSLPGPHGIGDFGPAAWHFVDWLCAAGQTLWQMLPTNPVGPGDSPYQSVSAFAGSPLMVALEPLVERGWLAPPTLPERGFSDQRVDFAAPSSFRPVSPVMFVPTREGEALGLACSFEATLAPGVRLRTRPDDAPTHWQQVFHPFPEPVTLRRGDVVYCELACSVADAESLRLELRVASGPMREVEAVVRQRAAAFT